MLELRRKISDTLPFEPMVCPTHLVTSEDVRADLESSGITSVDIYKKYKEHIKTHRGGWVAAYKDGEVFRSALHNARGDITLFVSYNSVTLGYQSYQVSCNINLASTITKGVPINQIEVTDTNIPSSGEIQLYRLDEARESVYYDSITDNKLNLSTTFTPEYTYEAISSYLLYYVKFEITDTQRCIIYNHNVPIDTINTSNCAWVYLGKDLKHLNISSLYYWTTGLKYIHCEKVNNIETLGKQFGANILTGQLTLSNKLKKLYFRGSQGITGIVYIPKSLENVEEGALSLCNFTSILPYDEDDQSPNCPVFSDTLYCSESYLYNGSIYPLVSNTLTAISGARLSSKPLELLPNVIIIGTDCFYNCQLRTCKDGYLTFPNTVTTVRYRAFKYCYGLSGQLLLNEGIESIGNDGFNKCNNFNNVDLTFPSTLLSIGDGAFADCTKLEGNLVIPNATTTILGRAFAGCINLGYYTSTGLYTGSLYIGSGMLSIGELAFYSCNFLNIYSTSSECPVTDNIIYSEIGTQCKAVYSAKKHSGTITFRDDTVIIYEQCCEYNILRTGILTIPANVLKIHRYAFEGCDGFTGLVINSTVLTEIREGAFIGNKNMTGSLTIPDSVTKIGNGTYDAGLVFYQFGVNNTSGSTLTIGSGVTIIYKDSFYQSNFTSIVWNGTPSVTTIEGGVFSRMDSLTGVFNIPASITSLGVRGGSVNNIIGGSGSVTITSSSSNYIVDSNIIYNASGTEMIGTCKIASAAPTILPTCTIIYGSAFRSSPMTGSLKIPSTVTAIGSDAFRYMSAITYIKFYSNPAAVFPNYDSSPQPNGKFATVSTFTGYSNPNYAYINCGTLTKVADIAALDAL